MQVVEGLAGLRRLPPRTVLSVGNYDGMHRGHGRLLAAAREMNAELRGSGVAVATFEPHPLTVLRPEAAPPRLTPPTIKRDLLAASGVDHLVVLPPTPDVLGLAAEEFWRILRDEVRPCAMVEGESFNFGKGRGGNIEKLRQWSSSGDVQLRVVEPQVAALLDLQVVQVSSSIIRWLLAHGRVRDAAICLGRAYVLQGPVVRGFQRGRTIGVPTANLLEDEQLVPTDGVYAGRCAVDGMTYAAAVSVGTMPTFGPNHRQIEAHLIGFSGDLYGRTITVEVVDWLRDQRKFAGVEALKVQLARDIDTAASRAGCDASRPIAIP